ncbi:MAG: matrixin family metalloprotease [Dehalococcoidia bacterium]
MTTRAPIRRTRPRALVRARLAVALAVALAGAALLGPATGGQAADAPAHARDITTTTAPAYGLQGFRWDRDVVTVYSNWEGGVCVVSGQDVTSGAPTIPEDVLNATLLASITEINERARGGITLQYAGPTTRRELCSTTTTRPIVIGFGSISSTGQAMSFARPVFGAPFASYEAARVFLSIRQNFRCNDAPEYRDLQHTMTHELLHAVGLDHSNVADSLMRPAYVVCRSGYTMQADDVAGLHALYPPTEPASSGTPAATATAAPQPTTGAGAFAQPVRFSPTGVAFTVFPGGDVEALELAAQAAGASGVWVQDAGGRFRLLVVNGPNFLRRQFDAAFPGGVPGSHAVTLVR